MTASERMNRFLIIAAQDDRLSVMHIYLYLVLCAQSASTVDIYFQVSRREIMKKSKIRGLATYHKCMRELHVLGYIDYVPSYHPTKGSTIRLNEFEGLINM